VKFAMYISLILLMACSPATSSENQPHADEGNIQNFESLSAVEIYENKIVGRYNVFEVCPESEGNFIFNKTNVNRNGHDYCQIGTMKKNDTSNKIFINLIECGSEGFPADNMQATLSKNNDGTVTFGGWWDYEPFSLYACPKIKNREEGTEK